MSTKAKLRLRHIEDADKSKVADAASESAAPKLVASAPPASNAKQIKSLKNEPVLAHEDEMSSSVGGTLRRGRQEKDLSLQDVAQQLRIQRSYLQALETGDFDNLPGLTYAIGYVRSYSQLVGLDAEKLITDFKAEAKKLQEPTQLSFPSPAPEGKVPGGALMFVGVLLAALSYGGWYYFSTSETSVSDLTPTIPDRLAFLLEEPAIESGASEPTAVTAETAPAASVAAPAEPAPEETTTAETALATDAPVANVDAETATDTAPEAEQVASASPEATAAAETVSEEKSPVALAPAPQQETETPEPVATASAPTVDVPAAPVTQAARPATAAEPVSADAATDTSTLEPATEIASVPATAPASAPADIPAVPDVSRSSSEPSAVNAEAAAIDSKPTPAPTASSEGPRIVISATDDSWVQVRGSDATPLLTRILRKGEQYEVPARSGLRLFTGNAGALKISVDGTEAPSLGPFGKIARNVPLDASLLTYTVSD
ncbi:DUF4115 domain-containing protein [Nisaea acidiphila]|uniref:DUF4115 domain-containing protein n=1 Tax=Nisaea acidiphila TaxID=1862145 RepID=A0A9J7AY62_9PROT|nr:RodZ domain-containing protein [Nisaea acidiphila]UUX52208.1 DUF4115 domain-containing protein [Nisaea acidiphila]